MADGFVRLPVAIAGVSSDDGDADVWVLAMSSATAGWIFEATVNQLFTHGQQSDQPIPKPIRMTSDGLGILTFTTPHHPSTDADADRLSAREGQPSQ
jgi:hypothetical protein